MLGACLRESATLTRLDVSENTIGDAGAVALANILHAEGRLVHLDLGMNKIGVTGMEALCSALETAPHLKHLGLAFNQLCHSGIRPLAKIGLGALETLDLRGNMLDDRAAMVLSEGIVACETISRIDVRENPNSREATVILGKAMRDRSRKYKESVRHAKKQAKKEKRRYVDKDPLPVLEIYWLEQHVFRALPGNGPLAQAATRACVIS
jgi:hypothetical protein